MIHVFCCTATFRCCETTVHFEIFVDADLTSVAEGEDLCRRADFDPVTAWKETNHSWIPQSRQKAYFYKACFYKEQLHVNLKLRDQFLNPHASRAIVASNLQIKHETINLPLDNETLFPRSSLSFSMSLGRYRIIDLELLLFKHYLSATFL